jgi:hypothetical protein
VRTRAGAFGLVVHLALGILVGPIGCGTQQWSFDDPDAEVDDEDAARPPPSPNVDASLADRMSGCARDDDCALSTLHCDVVSHECFACVADEQCTDPNRPRCDVALHQCVQCGVDRDCPAGEQCEPTSLRCVASCADGGGCPPSAPICSARGMCIRCASDGECTTSTSGPVCSIPTGQCVQCTADRQCASPLPRCDLTANRCVQCLGRLDCGVEQTCDPGSRTCVHEI